MKLSNKYKSSEYLFLFSILVLALLLGTYFSFYAFLWRDIKSEVKGFSKDLHMNYYEGMKSASASASAPTSSCQPGYILCPIPGNNCNPTCIEGNICDPDCPSI
jgi:hypothetical protein